LFVTFYDGFAAKIWRPTPFYWFSYEEGDGSNVVTFFFGGLDVNKAMATSNFYFYF
jgi:hypothetical protein